MERYSTVEYIAFRSMSIPDRPSSYGREGDLARPLCGCIVGRPLPRFSPGWRRLSELLRFMFHNHATGCSGEAAVSDPLAPGAGLRRILCLAPADMPFLAPREERCGVDSSA